MDFDFTWLLWGLPIAFALGWVASRLDLRQWRIEGRQAPKAYFRGLNHLLNEQQDQAIDAFIEAVQGDPDTAELHFALGNLFRRRGDYDRAVRVHEHLISRADLTQKDRDRAQYALALDFLKAGLLDRAEEALKKLEGTDHESEASMALLGIYERSRDWPRAQATARKLDAENPGSYATRLAHFLCEEAEMAHRQGDLLRTRDLLEQAASASPQLARAWMSLSALDAQEGHAGAALDKLLQLEHHSPQHLPLAAARLAELAKQTDRVADVRPVLQAADARGPSIDITQALASLDTTGEQARQEYLTHLEREPSLVMATAWLEAEPEAGRQAPAPVLRALQVASGPQRRYRCAACGFEAQRHFWQCPGCQTWDSYPARRVEEL